MKKLSVRFPKLIAIAVIAVTGLHSSYAQDPARSYQRGIKAFYEEDFSSALYYFDEIESTGKSYKDSKYRLAISKLVMREFREEPLDLFIKYRDTSEMLF